MNAVITAAPTTVVRQLAEQSAVLDQNKHDHVVSACDLNFDEACRLNVNEAGLFPVSVAPMTLTDWAYGQMFDKAGRAAIGRALPADYMKAIDPDWRAYNLNRAIEKAKDRKWTVRGYDTSCRAVLAGDYPRKPGNTDILNMLGDILEAEPGLEGVTMIRPAVSANYVYFKGTFRDVRGTDGDYGLGVMIRNGEIGNYALEVDPLVQRGPCQNSIVPSTTSHSTRIIHRGHWSEVALKLKMAILEALRGSAETFDRLTKAEAEALPTFSAILDGLCDEYGFDASDKVHITNGTEGHLTRAGLVNGVTYFAHHCNTDDPEKMLDAERLGGKLLYADRADLADYVTPAVFQDNRKVWAEYIAGA